MRDAILKSRLEFLLFFCRLHKTCRPKGTEVQDFYLKGELPIDWLKLLFEQLKSEQYDYFYHLLNSMYPLALPDDIFDLREIKHLKERVLLGSRPKGSTTQIQKTGEKTEVKRVVVSSGRIRIRYPKLNPDILYILMQNDPLSHLKN